MNCETAKDLMVLLNYGELSFEDEDALETHVERCSTCLAERAKLQRLDVLLEEQSTPVSPELLARCRRDLNERVLADRVAGARFSIAGWWQSVISSSWLKPATALVLLAVGFAGGKLIQSRQVQFVATQPGISRPVEDRAQTIDPASPEVEAATPAGYVPSRQRETAEVPDARVRNLLLAAVSDQDPALRVDSIDLLQARCGDETVRRTLMDALKTDKNSGVRLKALEALRPYARNPETRVVLAGVVLNDTSPTIRAQAIDLLVLSRGSDVASTLQEVLRREENPYIRERSVHALRAMKASAGTF